MKFKIHTKEVRRAAKKKNLTIKPDLTIEEDYGLICACPIGALYLGKEKKDLVKNEYGDYDLPTSFKIFKWAEHKYGKNYVNGFIRGFDNEYGIQFIDSFSGVCDYDDYERLNKPNKAKYKQGFRNGQQVRKCLLGK